MATTKPQKGKIAAPAQAAPQSKVQTAPQPKVKAALAPQLPFLFSKENYIIMIAGVAVIILGFALMTGVANDNPAVFPREEIYSFRRITLAPIVVLLGFAIEVYAILKRPKTA